MQAPPRQRRQPRYGHLKPLTVSATTAQRLLDISGTKYWELVKEGKLRTVPVGKTDMVVYSSLEALVEETA